MNRSSEDAALEVLNASSTYINEKLKSILEERRVPGADEMYDMLGYFFGFLDENLRPIANPKSGKRFRPALCLLIADGYGSRDKTFDAALAIELFHNFTLIHDDVEDRDEYRRNRPTLWKLWGVNHAINAGDVLSLIACELSFRAGNNFESGSRLTKTLLEAFREVIEGQYIDFKLVSESINSGAVNEEQYMLMTEKKTGALVGAAAEAAGIATGQNDSECASLREYGRFLGTSFQIADDYRSIWSTRERTGKDAQSDIRERKRTLPFIIAYRETSAKKRLGELYSLERQLSDSEIQEVRTIINETSARTYMLALIKKHGNQARIAANTLSLPKEKRIILSGIVDALVAESRP